MAAEKAGGKKPEKSQQAGAAGGPEEEGKVPVAALRSDQLKKLQTSQQSLQRSPTLDLP
uniref:Uncharacterized protein n=1 Tax=Macaca nemestrina TaxID=9545 RepID=A0A2K6D9K6_MACNE